MTSPVTIPSASRSFWGQLDFPISSPPESSVHYKLKKCVAISLPGDLGGAGSLPGMGVPSGSWWSRCEGLRLFSWPRPIRHRLTLYVAQEASRQENEVPKNPEPGEVLASPEEMKVWPHKPSSGLGKGWCPTIPATACPPCIPLPSMTRLVLLFQDVSLGLFHHALSLTF